MKKTSVKLGIFIPTVVISLLITIAMYVDPEAVSSVIYRVLNFLLYDFGWIYLGIFIACFALSCWLAFSKYGKIVIGGADSKKEYSEFSWAAMVFTAGIGIGVLVLGFIEPISFVANPPFHIEPLSDQAYEYAHMYSQFLWGVPGWLCYAPTTVAVAYYIYELKKPALRLSMICEDSFGKKKEFWMTLIDVVVALAILGGVSTSLGMGVPTVSGVVSYVFNWADSTKLTVAIFLIFLVIFSIDVWAGLKNGIKKVSNINMWVFGVFVILVTIKTPLMKTINMEFNSLGLILDNFGMLMLGTDPITQSGFPQNWTIFYWAWMLTFLPMMGLFVARISKGRTIREIVLGEGLWGGLGCMLSFGLFGGYVIHLQKNGMLDLISILETKGRPAAVAAILNTLPMRQVTIIIYVLLLFLFLCTTVDSTVYTLSSICTKTLSGEEEPARWHRLLWLFILLAFSLGLIIVGGLEAVQIASVVIAFPLVFVVIYISKVLLGFLKRRTEETGN